MTYESLKEKYAIPLLLFLLDKNKPVNKTELRENVIKPISSLDKLLNKLKEDGLIEIKEVFLGRRVYLISLTENGRAVAEGLKILEHPPSLSIFPEWMNILIYLSNKNQDEFEKIKEHFQGGSVYSSIQKLVELKLVEQSLENSKNIIKLTEKGEKVAKKLSEVEEILSKDKGEI